MDINRKKCKSFFYEATIVDFDYGACYEPEKEKTHTCTLVSSLTCKYYSPGKDSEWGPAHKKIKEIFELEKMVD